jgi:hypothetical protein
MGYQGARRAGSATGPHRQASWPPPDDPGTGAQTATARTPVRGFPPVNPARPGAVDHGPVGHDQPEPARNGSGPWPRPGAQVLDDTDPAGTRRRGAKTAKTKRPRRRSRTAWLTVGLVAVIAAGGFAAYKYLYEPRVNAPVSSSLKLPTAQAGSPEFNKALGKWQHIGTRAEDPVPPTLAELYPPRFTFNGSSYLRVAASVTKDCTQAVYGSQLQAALRSGHCTQVLRASYVSGTMMGTIGVVNLSTASAAQTAGRATGPQEIIAPLSSQKGPASKLGTGTGVVQAEIKGHYLILMWAEFTNLKSPSTQAQRQLLEQFAANLVTGSANIDLSTRMLTGKASAST